MATKQTKEGNGDLASRLTVLEEGVAKLEKLARNAKKATRKKREYTEEERKAIRARLLAGQQAAKSTKAKPLAASSTKPTQPFSAGDKDTTGTKSDKSRTRTTNKPIKKVEPIS